MSADLFSGAAGPLLDDASGRIVLTPDWIDPTTAAAWFDVLHGDVDWRDERRLMYEREVDVPRLLASYRLDAGARLPQPIADAHARLREHCEVPFNSVGLNLYRDQHDSVAPHNDRLHELVPGHPIVLLSLGATRPMLIRAKRPPRRVLQLDLQAGSLLSMSWEVQLHYDHGIPKLRTPVAPRISLVFRVRRR